MTSQPPPGPSRADVDLMFDRIAFRYDVANAVLSMRLDRGWRRALINALPSVPSALDVLDVATGTGDVAVALAHDARVRRVRGVDVSTGMLARAKEKSATLGFDEKIRFAEGDATRLGFDKEFDVVTIAFGIRNVKNTAAALASMHDALRPGGRVLILEFAEPTTPGFSTVYRLYRRYILPVIGGALTGDRAAYAYLDDTIATFPSGGAFCDLLGEAGFDDVTALPLTFGAVMLYAATRRAL